MRVIATAGHVDHGKSTLVRALTGIEPDRWAQEKARGLTIDLGYAWTTLADGTDLAFVDVPGHERFIANMLAGLGPSPAVMLVIAADEGWREQSQEHFDAIRALGIRHGVLAVTRSDLADPAAAIAQARTRMAGSGLAECEAVAVSGVTGEGLDDLRAALGRLGAHMPTPDPAARVRLWLDREFTVKGAGTVVTGTLEAGTITVGDRLDAVAGSVTGAGAGTAGASDRAMRHPSIRGAVRGIESLGRSQRSVSGAARVALNLRGVAAGELTRGDVLVTPMRWHLTSTVDARLDPVPDALPDHLTAHVGTTSRQVAVRPLAPGLARLRWEGELPLQAGDRLVLRNPGRQLVVCGAVVLDADPPVLDRRGAGRRRGEELMGAAATIDTAREVTRRGCLTVSELRALGGDPGPAAPGVQRHGDLFVSDERWSQWVAALREIVREQRLREPLRPGVAVGEVVTVLALRASSLTRIDVAPLVQALASEAGLELERGVIREPGSAPDLGPAEAGLVALEQRLAERPFRAPERGELADLGLGPRQLAAAVALGRLVDLGDNIVLTPVAPAQAMRLIAALPQPFSTAQAREALGTTRRVAIPLLEHLDARGWTRRIDAGHREVVRTRTETR
ncbi:MAG: SelB C-terminal domain-containing protein [Dermatophilus congolensis]|nr:SelB C-terminal domain-containing protein [Dermatophilus congolensis]